MPAPTRRAFRARLRTLTRVLTGAEGLSLADELDAIAMTVGHESDQLWLAHSVLAAELPAEEKMRDLLVHARLGGTWAALVSQIAAVADADHLRDVQVLQGAVTCDVHATARSDFLSGIQRVVRETVGCWQGVHEVELVGWVRDFSAFRRLREEERRRMHGDLRPLEDEPRSAAIVVPWESTHLWVEVVTEERRTARLLALAKHSRNTVGVLGYDSIPVTSSATVAKGMTSHFARGLAAARFADRVAMISDTAATEFRGVLAMGSGRRDRGPEVASIRLPVVAPAPVEVDLAEARQGLVMDDTPMVLVVGSHEPRKNHLAVLHAAEILWREGLRFSLVLIGAGAWDTSEYDRVLSGLAGAGRPIQSIRGLPDRLLWAAYQLAHVTLFPSLNEGFGLPVAESLAAGTPVITSQYGSMRDIVAPDGVPLGGLLVDPRDDLSIVDALRTALTDDSTYARLRLETSQHADRSWDDYAGELWSFLVDKAQPGS